MLFQRIQSTDPQKVFIIGYNSSADAWSNGYPVRWDYSTDKDGVGMEKPAAKGATGLGRVSIAGVVAESIAASAYGLVQVYGYHSAVRVTSATTGSGSVIPGTALVGCKTAWYALENAGKTGTQANCYAKGFALATRAEYTTAAIAAFILCM